MKKSPLRLLFPVAVMSALIAGTMIPAAAANPAPPKVTTLHSKPAAGSTYAGVGYMQVKASKGDRGYTGCSGTLIEGKMFLAAGHCFPKVRGRHYSAEVFLGMYNPTTNASKYSYAYKCKITNAWDFWNGKADTTPDSNDLAIMRLPSHCYLKNNTTKVALKTVVAKSYSFGLQTYGYRGTSGPYYSVGYPSNKPLGTQVRLTGTPVKSKYSYGVVFNGSNVAKGYSGAGLFKRDSSNKRWYVEGLVSDSNPKAKWGKKVFVLKINNGMVKAARAIGTGKGVSAYNKYKTPIG